ncbi:MAG: Antitoxin [Thermodesulfobacteriota bacterium]|nr:Antitoxin [Thermodesulfobacteriota bacterium]
MKTATVGDIQKSFAKVLKEIGAGEEITVLRRGKPVAAFGHYLSRKGPQVLEWRAAKSIRLSFGHESTGPQISDVPVYLQC